MKDQMQYIVIEGRKPQDGAKPAQALLILPKWISPTLACAGIVGRVIELTDGNVIEQGAVFMGEQETLDSLRVDISQDSESQLETDDRHEQELQAEGVTAPVVATGSFAEANIAQQRDDAYREGMQAARTSIVKRFTEHGMPEGAGMGEWFKAQMEELERHRNAALPVKLNALLLEFGGKPGGEGYEFLRGELEELAQFRKDRPETLAKLQHAENQLAEFINDEKYEQCKRIADRAVLDMQEANARAQAAEDNLDAWRDAAGRNPMIVQNTDSQTGRIVSLGVDKGANGDVVALNRQVAELQTQLQEFEGVDENFQALNEALTHRDHRIEQLRKDLKKIRKLVKAAL